MRHARFKTGPLDTDGYAARQRDLDFVRGYKQIWLPKAEYAHVVSELNTNLTAEELARGVLTKGIGNYRYTFIINGFDDYIFIRKEPIE